MTVAALPNFSRSASQGGVNQLTRVLALQWSARGVTVNAVAPRGGSRLDRAVSGAR
jgi:NAD(P)-dependent dehydrogenase (short-subunit alcohol dehydrogenase family)